MRLKLALSAQKDFKKLNPTIQKQVFKKLNFLVNQPEPLRFATKPANFSRGGDYRFRIGSYRVIFDVINDTIYGCILNIAEKFIAADRSG